MTNLDDYQSAISQFLDNLVANTQTATAAQYTQQINDLKAQIAAQVTQISALQGQVNQQAVIITDLNSKLAAAQATITSQSATIAQLNNTIASMQATIDDLRRQLGQQAKRFPGDPGPNKLYYGESREGGDPAQRESYFGHNVGIFRSYSSSPNVSFSVNVAKRDVAAGRIPLHSTKLPGTWADVAAGKYDATFLQPLMDGLSTVPGPVWLCFHHEPYDDQGAGQTPADYVAIYRHVKTMQPANVALVPILQSAPFDPTVYGKQDIKPWFDPTTYDITGIDQYNHWFPGGRNKWRDPETMVSFLTNYLDQFEKPIVVAEWGVRTDPANPGKAAAWMSDYHDLLVNKGNVVAASFFDSGQNVFDGGSSWSLDYNGDGTDGKERLNAFKANLTAPGSVFYTG